MLSSEWKPSLSYIFSSHAISLLPEIPIPYAMPWMPRFPSQSSHTSFYQNNAAPNTKGIHGLNPDVSHLPPSLHTVHRHRPYQVQVQFHNISVLMVLLFPIGGRNIFPRYIKNSRYPRAPSYPCISSYNFYLQISVCPQHSLLSLP